MTTNRSVRSGGSILAGMACLALTLIGPPGADARAATLTVPSLIGNHMVLQRGMPDPIWGTAPAGATVTVRFNRHTVSTTAAANGRWRLDLPGMPATTSPGRLTITSGREKLTFTDVQVGEVWGCSGQSNMDLSLGYSSGGSAAAADAPNHDIRLFSAPETTTPDHVAWTVSDPTTARAFSAVCYYFGRELAEHFGVPIGLIQSTRGGTYIEEWTHASGGSCTSMLLARRQPPRSDGRLYDTKIKPLMPYAIRGFAWYQGENDSRDCTAAYFRELQALINEWRTAWGEGDFPFGIVQLPFGRTPQTQEAQLQAFLTVPNTFLAITTDLPDLGGTALHPANKKPVGLRLAIGARAIAYGESIEPVGPIRDLATSHVSGSTVVIGFTHLGERLVTGSSWQPAGAPTPFRLAGANGRFHTASARIVGNTVEVTSRFVPNPVEVRYTGTYGRGNLYSKVRIPIQGGTATYRRLPAAPFEMILGPVGDGRRLIPL
jgi:sialate O-acetylesterase